ncbi:ATP-binding protein [Paraburkholderia sp. SIMBA_054]|uniref:hybrid sensor histidine kinase/response regulator n=1 Tax=Paraburkholderia sp. SIMBA_054 TaxID=3085795 RepID=UPI00397C7E2C
MNSTPEDLGTDPRDDPVPNELPPPSRNFAATRKVLLFLLAVSVLVPVGCLAGYGYYDYQRRFNEAADASDRMARVAEEQALKVMDLNTELASRVEELLDDMTDGQVSQNEAAVHGKLNSIAGNFPQVVAISAFGESGTLLASSRYFPVPQVNVGTRADFVAAKHYRPEPYVSLPMAASISGTSVFNTAKARSASDGRFLGIVSIALRRDYFFGFYQKLLQNDEEGFIGLYRADGALLASYPNVRIPAGALASPALTEGFTRNEYAGHLQAARFGDHQKRFVAYRRVGDYRLFVAAGFPVGGLISAWQRHLLLLCGLAVLPCAAIWALLGFSLRQLSAEERAWLQWRSETSRRLAAEASGRHLQRMGALGNLVANVAHEFNNHLMAVKSNMAIARSKGFTDVAPEVSAVERATHSVEGLVRTLVGATQKQPLKLTQVDPATALPGLKRVLQATVGDAISVNIDIAQELWQIRCDYAELELTLINLALNAREAMPRGGKLRIRAQNVEAASDAAGVPVGEFVLVSVSDDGIGMTQAVAHRAFEPLFTTKLNGTGAGLGLTQVLAFCERSGGTARITSAPGLGTTVRLYLPKSVARDIAVTEHAAGDPGRRTEFAANEILLVEDNDEVAAGLSAVLELMGHHVTRLANADDALLTLQTGQQFRLVLSDVQMPGKLNGIDLAEWLKANRPEQPLALMTGYADELERARNTGVPIFAKPFDVGDLEPLFA